MKIMQYINNTYTRAAAAATLLFELASCGFGLHRITGLPWCDFLIIYLDSRKKF